MVWWHVGQRHNGRINGWSIGRRAALPVAKRQQGACPRDTGHRAARAVREAAFRRACAAAWWGSESRSRRSWRASGRPGGPACESGVPAARDGGTGSLRAWAGCAGMQSRGGSFEQARTPPRWQTGPGAMPPSHLVQYVNTHAVHLPRPEPPRASCGGACPACCARQPQAGLPLEQHGVAQGHLCGGRRGCRGHAIGHRVFGLADLVA